MEPEGENPDNEHLVPWSGSDGSQELCASESLAESYNEDDVSESEYPVDTLPPCVSGSDPDTAACLQSGGWESAGEQQSLPEASGSEVSYQEEDDSYRSESSGSITESPHNQTSPTSPEPERHSPKPPAGQISQAHSSSSSSSLGCAADMTLALTLSSEQPVGASNKQGAGTGNRRVQSSEEGGSSEAPPASVFFGISDEGAEQAEKRNSGSDTDLCRPERHRRRHTRLGHRESQSERHVKETKSKCKRIARLLTEAPNPQNKGALLFKKRRQRVKKYTLVSYGTGDNYPDSEDQFEEGSEEVKCAGYNLVATSDSELEEDYCVYRQQQNISVNWESVGEMDALPETKGKGVLMFAQRRKRMDELVSENEERLSKGLPVEVLTEPECPESQDMYDTKETYGHVNQANYIDESLRQHLEYQDNTQQINHLVNVPKPLVPNRTAKPFHGFHDGTSPISPSGIAPVTKKHDTRFRVPVPTNSNPQVWSPTGDIIASRDERISVPAIKTGILPESKRKSTKPSTQAHQKNPQLQSKGERRSYIESEEDCFSLGAEACNFMQPRLLKLKNPPPVAPKPTINPACPPWLGSSPSDDTYILPRSPVSQPSHSSVGPQGQHYLQQQDWAQSQQMANRRAPDQAQAKLQTPPNAWAQVSSPSQLYPQPTTNSWSQQPPRSPVSMQAHSPTYSPHPPPVVPRNKSVSAPNSFVSCPPQAGKSHIAHAPKSSQAPSKGRLPNKGVNRASDGPTMSGKGAELFARRQSRMEKFVVDDESVQANKERASSPTSSLPNSWRYSTNVRAPPPLSYNPLHAPSYPSSANKQVSSTNAQNKPKTKEKPKAKHLNSLDIMKHQPYQLDSSLFKYDAAPEAKTPKPAPVSKFEQTKSIKHRSLSHSSYNASEHDVQGKAEASAKSPGPVSSQSSSACQSTASAASLPADKHLDEKHTVAPGARHKTKKQAQSTRSASTTSQQSSTGDSIASAFSPASLIARGVRQMAPWPKFSAKKPAESSKHWRPVAMIL